MAGLSQYPPFAFSSASSSPTPSLSSTPSGKTITPAPFQSQPRRAPPRRSFSLPTMPQLPIAPNYGTMFAPGYRNPLAGLFAPSPTSDSSYENQWAGPTDGMSGCYFLMMIVAKGVGIGLVVLLAVGLCFWGWKWVSGNGGV